MYFLLCIMYACLVIRPSKEPWLLERPLVLIWLLQWIESYNKLRLSRSFKNFAVWIGKRIKTLRASNILYRRLMIRMFFWFGFVLFCFFFSVCGKCFKTCKESMQGLICPLFSQINVWTFLRLEIWICPLLYYRILFTTSYWTIFSFRPYRYSFSRAIRVRRLS